MKTTLVVAILGLSVCALSAVAQEKPAVAAESAPKSASDEPGVAAAAPVRDPEEVVARVNGEEIKRSHLEPMLQAVLRQRAAIGQPVPTGDLSQLERDVLDELITRQLLLQEGRGKKIEDLDAKVRAHIENVKEALGGEESLKRELEGSGISEREYTSRVEENIIIRENVQAVMEKEAKVTPEDVKSYYEENPQAFLQPELVRASHILVRVPEDASDEQKAEKRSQIDAVRERLAKGESFADVARDVSEDPVSGRNGGDLGFFRRGVMVPEFDTAAFLLKTDELSEVITTRFGYHLLIVTDRRPEGQLAFDEVKDDLEQFLRSRKGADVARKHVSDLRSAAKIEVLLKQPADAPPPAALPGGPASRPDR